MEIVCVHGAGEAASIWDGQRAVRGLRAIDLPGHGGASGPGLRTISAYADAVAGELEGSEPLVLAGHSMGGAIALELALRSERPPWLAGLALVATGARLRVHPEILDALENDWQRARELLEDWSTAPAAGDVRIHMDEMLRRSGQATVLGDYRAVDAFDRMEDVGRVDLPAVAIVGTRDRMTPPKYARYFTERMPDCRLVEVAGAGHMVTMEAPLDVARALGMFRDMLQS